MGTQRAKHLILAILRSARGEVPKVKLAKLILLADIRHFRRTGRSISGMVYVKKELGPVISHFDRILEEGEGVLWERSRVPVFVKEKGKEVYQVNYRGKTGAVARLTRSQQATVAETVKEFGGLTGTQLSEKTHGLPAWRYSEIGEPIYIEELAISKEAEYFAFIDFVEGLEEEEEGGETGTTSLEG